MLRILWVSNSSWAKTGYGVQTLLFTQRIKDAGHEIAVLGYYGLEGSMLNYNGIMHYPKSVHPYGQDIMGAHAQNFNADIIMSLMDVWVFIPANASRPWVPYYPVDHEPMPPKVREALSGSYKRIAMSKFGVEESHKAGLECYYVPHGVDTKIYKPQDKKESRKKLGLPEDAWIVGTVAMNKGQPSRKSIPSMLQAFANFKKKHTDAVYYLHTQKGDGIDGLGGVNMPEIISLLGLQMGKDVFMTDPYAMALGVSEDWMATLYSSFDVHMLASMGEGFGIPIIEAQSCGVPVIVGGWTSMPELVKSGQIIDKSDAEPTWTGIASYQWQPKVAAIERKMELEYKKPSPNPRDAIVKEYDIDFVFNTQMLPALTDIEKCLAESKQRYADVAEARQ